MNSASNFVQVETEAEKIARLEHDLAECYKLPPEVIRASEEQRKMRLNQPRITSDEAVAQTKRLHEQSAEMEKRRQARNGTVGYPDFSH